MDIKKRRVLAGCVASLIMWSMGMKTYAQQPENPVLWADVPDPSIIRVDSMYYMSSTTMHMNPGVPIMRSQDLVNWEIVNYAYDVLGESDHHTLTNGKNEYGRGSWASSLRYHDGVFYLATFSYTTQKTYIFKTKDIEHGSWEAFELDGLFHDPSLFFDDDQAYLLYGIDDIKIIELSENVTSVKKGGVDQILIPDSKSIFEAEEFYVPAEGAHGYKVNETYYVMLISWPAGGMRTQVVYRADELLGDYKGKIVLEDQGVAQGGFIDTPEGDWYAFLFKDHGAVGRIPMLVPMHWENEWPVLGVNSKVPEQLDIATEGKGMSGIVASDEFDSSTAPKTYNDETSILQGLPLVWQWNHVPDSEYWSLTERSGYLRLTNGRIDSSFTSTQNTLTQRTFGPECTGSVLVDVSKMSNGDVAGLGALQGTYGYVGVKMEEGQKYVTMTKGSPESINEMERLPLGQDEIYLKISFDYNDLADKAYFYYSLNGKEWNQIGEQLEMVYTLEHFMGARFALFNYATQQAGGVADFDFFRVSSTLFNQEN